MAQFRPGMWYPEAIRADGCPPTAAFRMSRLLLLLPVFCLASTAVLGSPARQPIEPFVLRDYRGREWKFEELAGNRLTVVVFLGVECPLAKLYAPRLAEMATQFAGDGVSFVGIDSNRQDLPTEVGVYAERHKLSFPILVDAGSHVADLFGARRTPEVFVLDAERTIQYHGRIDDQHRPGTLGLKAKHHDLRDALVALLAGDRPACAETEVYGCIIGRPRQRPAAADAAVTWSKDVAAIFQKRCQECHRPGDIGPFPLLTYSDVQGWEGMIEEVVSQDRMPPWHANPRFGRFANDMRLADDEKQLILAWIQEGAPEGDPALTPPARAFSSDWSIRPDDVYWMSSQPFVIPAEEKLDYQYFVVDPSYTEDRWVKAVECRPGNRAVVHHINVFVLLPEVGDDYTREELTNHLLWAYAPGFRGVEFAPGMARRIPAGAKYVFQMHYSPTGRVEQDRSSMGVVYAEPGDVNQQLEIALAVNNAFEIPPGAANHRVVSWFDVKRDSLLIALHPHMHLRGRDFRFEAILPDGAVEVLLDIPRFDFNWQYDYRLAQPKPLLAGTKICCVAHYDNSPDNVGNPDPLSFVRWGDQTWQEMMIGYLHLATPRDSGEASQASTASATSRPPLLVGLLLLAAVTGVVIALYRTTSRRARHANALVHSANP